MPHLELAAVSKSFKSNKVLDDISLVADAGEIVVIFGPSGTGKTVLLRLIAGVEEPTSGAIRIDNQDMADVAPEHRDVGMAFQNFVGLEALGNRGEFKIRHDQPFTAPRDRPSTR